MKWCINIKSGNESSSRGYVGMLVATLVGVLVGEGVGGLGDFLRHTHSRLSRIQPEQLGCFSSHWNASEAQWTQRRAVICSS